MKEIYELERAFLNYLFPQWGRNFLKNIRNNLIFIIVIVISLMMWLLCILNVFKEYKNLPVLADSGLIMVTQTAMLCKYFNLFLKRTTFEELENFLNNPQLLKQNSKLIKQDMEHANTLMWTYRILCMTCTLSFLAIPLINDNPRSLPLMLWNPLDINNKFKYIVTFIFHSASITISALVNITLDILTVKIFVIIITYLKILKFNLVSENYNLSAEKSLIENICLHNKILKIVKITGWIFSPGIFIQMFSSVSCLCFTAFKMLDVSFTNLQSIVLTLYLLVMFTQIFLYCWFGQLIKDNSMDINDAMYCSNWYKTNVKMQKPMITLMEQCKKPIVLTAGSQFDLTLTTLVNILKWTYSYLTMLRSIYDDE